MTSEVVSEPPPTSTVFTVDKDIQPPPLIPTTGFLIKTQEKQQAFALEIPSSNSKFVDPSTSGAECSTNSVIATSTSFHQDLQRSFKDFPVKPHIISSSNRKKIKQITELIALDHCYAASPPIIPFPPLLPVFSTNSSNSNTGLNSSGGDISASAPASPSPKNSTSKSKQSAIKYILDNNKDKEKKKEKPEKAKKGRPPKAGVSASTTSKLESLLKSPVRRGSTLSSPTYSSSSTCPSPLIFDKFDYLFSQEEEIDIVTPSPLPKIKYDAPKARNLMHECEKFVNLARPTDFDVPENWESQIVKTGWTRIQKMLFEQTLKLLHEDRLARLANAGNPSEPVLRRLSIDRTAQRLRTLLTKVSWDSKLTQWLHEILKDNLSWEYLASYLDILQTIRAKVPTLIDKMILLSTTAKSSPVPASSPSTSETTNTGQIVSPVFSHQSAEALNLLLKRKWDPFSTVLKQTKTRKLQCEPLFLLLPCGPSWGNPVSNRRTKTFLSMLGTIGKTIIVTVKETATLNASVDEYAEKLVNASRFKLHETKTCFPERPVFLIGWGAAAVIAVKLALMEKVAGIICLGFPLFTLRGKRGGVFDNFLSIKVPSLFVIGDKSRNTTVTAMDAFRKQLTAPSMLVVINGGDAYLNVKRKQKKLMLLTQTSVDKNIVDEITMFINVYCAESISASIIPTPYSDRLNLSSKKLPTVPVRSLSPKKAATSKLTYSSILNLGSHSRTKISKKLIKENGNFDRGQLFDDVDDYAEATKVPSNTSSNRRKAYFRASNPTPSSASVNIDKTTAPSNMTASQLLQQIHQADAVVHSKSDSTTPTNTTLGKPENSSPTKMMALDGLQNPLNTEISNMLSMNVNQMNSNGSSNVNLTSSVDANKTEKEPDLLSESTSLKAEPLPPIVFPESTIPVSSPLTPNGANSSLSNSCSSSNLTNKHLTVTPNKGEAKLSPAARQDTGTRISDGFQRPLNTEISNTLNDYLRSLTSLEVNSDKPTLDERVTPNYANQSQGSSETKIPSPTGVEHSNVPEPTHEKPVQEKKSVRREKTKKNTEIRDKNGRKKLQLSTIRIDNVCSLATTTQSSNNDQASIPSLVPVLKRGEICPSTTENISSNVCSLNPTDIEQLNKVLQAKGSDISTILASGKRIVVQKTLKPRTSVDSNSNGISSPTEPSSRDSPALRTSEPSPGANTYSLETTSGTYEGHHKEETEKIQCEKDKDCKGLVNGKGHENENSNSKCSEDEPKPSDNSSPATTSDPERPLKRRFSSTRKANKSSKEEHKISSSNSNSNNIERKKRTKTCSLSSVDVLETNYDLKSATDSVVSVFENTDDAKKVFLNSRRSSLDTTRRKRNCSGDSISNKNEEDDTSSPIAKRTRFSKNKLLVYF